MKLLIDIIRAVSETKEPVADTLRRCLVLAYQLKNDKLKAWAEKELMGYDFDEELPDYRTSPGIAKGLFLGSFGRQLQDQPLAAHILKPEDRHWADRTKLTQPIAAYEGNDDRSNGILPWPGSLVTRYQTAFFQDKDIALNRAWMEIPASTIVGLVDTVRTRVLIFALQMREELKDDSEEAIQALPASVVDRIVNITILGGHNVIGNVNEFNGQTVVAGDVASLKQAMTALGVTSEQFTELETSLQQDLAGGKENSIGGQTVAWIRKAASTLGQVGQKVGSNVAQQVLEQAVRSYLGL